MGENQIPSESDLSRHSGYLLDGRWRVLPAENRVIGPDTDRRIADKYMRVLVHLCDHPTVVTREELLQAVWPDTVVVEEVLTRAVSELRKIFGDDPRASHFIETIPKRGYRLLVPVTPLPAQAVTTPTGPRLWTGWRPRVAPLLGMAAAVVAGVAFWMIVLDARIHRSDQPGPAPSLLQLTSLKGVEEYPTLSPEGTRLAFAWEGDEKTPTGIFVLPLGQDTPLALTPPHGHYAYPAWSPDGKFVAYSRVAGQDPGLFQVPAGGGTEKLLVPVREGRPSITPDFSPDGKTLVYAAPMGTQQGWHLETLDLQEGRTAPLTRDLPTGTWDRRPRYSPDGATVAFIRTLGARQVLGLIPAAGGSVLTLDPGERGIRDFDWMPDGRQLLVSADDGMWRVDARDGSRQLVSADRGLSCVSVATDGSLAAFTKASGQWGIHALDPDTGRLTPVVDSSRYDGRPALSPVPAAGGRDLAFITNRRGRYALWTADCDGGRPRALLNDADASPDHPAWSPDGTLLAFDMLRDGHAVVAVMPAGGGAPRVLTEPGQHEAAPSFSRDGRFLYFRRSEQGHTRIFRRPVQGGPAVPVTGSEGWRAEESLDGTRLFVQERSWENHRLLSLDPANYDQQEDREVDRLVAVDLDEDLLVDWAPVAGGCSSAATPITTTGPMPWSSTPPTAARSAPWPSSKAGGTRKWFPIPREGTPWWP